MQRQVLLPQVELTMESVIIAKWLVRAGDRVREQEPIIEVETQKATTEVPSPAAGYVRQLCVEEGQTVGAKALLCIMTDTANEPVEFPDIQGSITAASHTNANQDSTKPDSEGLSIKASPAARRLAREEGVTLSAVRGTGPSGRITEKDVQAAASMPDADSQWQELSITRIALIEQMRRSLAEIPQICIRRQLDVTRITNASDGATFTHRVAKAVARALVDHPSLRTIFDSNCIRVAPVSVAIAMDTRHGLVAPVVRGADELSVEQMSAAIKELQVKAEANTVRCSELTDAPFAISNLGMLGVDQFDGFVFHGQTAVLSIGRSATKSNGRDYAWFGLSVDHRIVDGAQAARFLETLQREILRQ